MSEARDEAAGRPSDAAADLRTVMAAHRAGDLAAAEAGYRAILTRDPDQADALHLLGLCLYQRKAGKEAFGFVRRAIRLKPEVAAFRHSLGRILRGAGQNTQAIRSFVQALRLDPGYRVAEADLAETLCDARRFPEAEALLKNSLGRYPDDPDLRCAYGRLLLLTDRTEAAVAALHSVLTVAPDHVAARNTLGVACNLAGKIEDARRAFERALALAPDHVDAHTNYGQLLLSQGAWAAGWAHHEWRLQRRDYRRRFAVPMWQGEPLDGKNILVWCEQGLGDAIHFIRYAPMVAARGGRVLVECRRPLHRLFAGIDGVADVFEAGKARDYAVHVPIMSLPRVFGTAPETIPAAVPYVPVPPPAAIDSRGARLKVGLVWAGNPDNLRDRARSRRLGEFAPLAALGDVAFFGLQVGAGADDPPPDGMAIVNLMPVVKDFYDTAAVLAALDLLITIDSSSAHLAGAMGMPVWVVLDTIADWRWLTGRDDTPWYPTMRLFRRDGSWPALFARIAEALRRFDPGR